MRYAALLRGINVGGTGKLPMKTLVQVCTDLGYENVRTYIQSGNVVFDSDSSATSIQADLERALDKLLDKKAYAIIRRATQLQEVIDSNPFVACDEKKVGVMFFQKNVTKNDLSWAGSAEPEQIVSRKKEVYIYFPNGMGRSKLKLPRDQGTMRNMNTVLKLAEMTKG